MVRNTDQRSRDYGNIAYSYRPGHADYTFDQKYGFRDYRGGGRSSGRETIGRVAAGAIASKILSELNISLCTYTKSIGPVQIDTFDPKEINNNSFYMPDAKAATQAGEYLEQCMKNQDSAGGVIECRINGVPAGLGDPVFDKLSAVTRPRPHVHWCRQSSRNRRRNRRNLLKRLHRQRRLHHPE